MAIIKETKYLLFDAHQSVNKKTKTISVINKSMNEEIAEIVWYPAWRQYCFFPSLDFDTVWNNTCLRDILEVLDMLMKEQQVAKPKGK